MNSNDDIVPVFELKWKEDRDLCHKAAEAAGAAYEPYSGFSVGAAVRTRNKKIYAGANLENAAYGVGMCAEVAAITAANSARDFNIEAIAVVGYPTEDRAAGSEIRPRSACSRTSSSVSWRSGRNVPAPTCNVILAMRTPRAASAASSSAVKCSPAVGAATAPGRVAKIVW